MGVEIKLQGQVAIVTGAGAGIGRASAETLAEAGASVVVSDRDLATAEETATAIRASGGQALGMACDVTDEHALGALVDAAIGKFGRLDILVNNAGGGGPKPFDMPMADFEWAYWLNVYSVFRLCQLAAPHMKAAGGGAIVNISSMAGENTNTRMASYASSKAAANHLRRSCSGRSDTAGAFVGRIRAQRWRGGCAQNQTSTGGGDESCVATAGMSGIRMQSVPARFQPDIMAGMATLAAGRRIG